MMKKDVMAATELCRKYPPERGIDSTADYERFTEARELIVAEYLRQHPADDNEPVTEAWLLSRGFTKVPSDMGPTYSDHFEIAAKHGVLNIYQFNDGPWLFDDADWHQMETLGDIRRLCRALGVERCDISGH